mgnify:CR=1 FL=1
MEITNFVNLQSDDHADVQMGTSVVVHDSHLSHANLMNYGEDVIINRTKEQISPFTGISKRPSYTAHNNLTGYGVEIDTPNGPELVGTVGPNYLLIPNDDVMRLGEEILGSTSYAYDVRRIFFDGGRFAVIFDLKDVRSHLSGRGDIGASLIIRNSYNGSWPLQASLMAIDFFCANGMISGQHFAGVKFKHVGEDKDWEATVRQGLGVLENASMRLDSFTDGLRNASNLRLTEHGLRDIVRKTALIKSGPTAVGKILSSYMKSEPPTAFGLLSACTANYWHGSKFSANDFKNNQVLTESILDYVNTFKS